jgi:hypothetical protein
MKKRGRGGRNKLFYKTTEKHLNYYFLSCIIGKVLNFLFFVLIIFKNATLILEKKMLSIKKIAHGLLVLGIVSQVCAMEVEEKKSHSKSLKTLASDQLHNPNAGKWPRLEDYGEPIDINVLDQDSENSDFSYLFESDQPGDNIQIQIPSVQELVARQQQLQRQQQIQDDLALAKAFYDGNGQPQNYINAAFYYQRAAQAGSPEAQNKLGSMLSKGKGLAVDKKKAA